MTIQKMINMASSKGIDITKWNELASFPLIFLDQRDKLVTDKTLRMRVNTDTELFEIVKGVEKNGDFYVNGFLLTVNTPPHNFYSLDAIAGFISSTYVGPNGMLITRNFKKL